MGKSMSETFQSKVVLIGEVLEPCLLLSFLLPDLKEKITWCLLIVNKVVYTITVNNPTRALSYVGSEIDCQKIALLASEHIHQMQN